VSGASQVLQHSMSVGAAAYKSTRLLRPKEAAELLSCSTSFLAKGRMRGDGPPFIKIGRAIRYDEAALRQWMKSRQRLSTSEQ